MNVIEHKFLNLKECNSGVNLRKYAIQREFSVCAGENILVAFH